MTDQGRGQIAAATRSFDYRVPCLQIAVNFPITTCLLAAGPGVVIFEVVKALIVPDFEVQLTKFLPLIANLSWLFVIGPFRLCLRRRNPGGPPVFSVEGSGLFCHVLGKRVRVPLAYIDLRQGWRGTKICNLNGTLLFVPDFVASTEELRAVPAP